MLPRDWRSLGWLLPLLLLPFLGIGSTPLFDLDEGAFTASTTEMFLRHDFLSTWLMGVPRYDKPILSYWLQAGSIGLFGPSEWAFRLPSALAASAWIGLSYAFARRIALSRLDGAGASDFGLAVAVLVATTLGPGIIERAATADALLNLWLAAAGYAQWLWLREGEERWRLLGFLAMGLGFLTKGPVAVVLPGGALFLYLASLRRLDLFWRWACAPKAIGLFLLVAAPWFLVQAWLEGPGFLLNFFFKHNLGRYAAPMEGHRGNLLFYLPVLLLSLLPHTGLLARALRAPRALWQDELSRYGLCWFVLVLALFSSAGTKLPHYLYYGYGGLFLILAGQVKDGCDRRWLALPAGLLFALLLALPSVVASRSDGFKPDQQLLLAGVEGFFGLGYYTWFGLALVAVPVLGLWRGLRPLTVVYAFGLLSAVGTAALLAPAVGDVQQAPIRAAGRIAATRSEPLVMLGINQPSFQTYAQRAVARRDPVAGDLVLTREARLDEVPDAEVIFRERSYVLAKAR